MTPDLQQRIRELHGRGLRDPKIAEALGLNRRTVENFRKKEGLKANWVVTEEGRVKRIAAAQRSRTWTVGMEDTVRALWPNLEMNMDAIASVLKVTAAAVESKARHLNLPARGYVQAAKMRAHEAKQRQIMAKAAAMSAKQQAMHAVSEQARFAAPPMPILPTESLEQAVARFARERGITRLPVAAVAVTTAAMPRESRAVIRSYHDEANAIDNGQWRRSSQANVVARVSGATA